MQNRSRERKLTRRGAGPSRCYSPGGASNGATLEVGTPNQLHRISRSSAKPKQVGDFPPGVKKALRRMLFSVTHGPAMPSGASLKHARADVNLKTMKQAVNTFFSTARVTETNCKNKNSTGVSPGDPQRCFDLARGCKERRDN